MQEDYIIRFALRFIKRHNLIDDKNKNITNETKTSANDVLNTLSTDITKNSNVDYVFDNETFYNNIYITIFWGLDDIFCYISNISLFAIKYSLYIFENIFSYNILSFFLSYYWYERAVADSQKSGYSEIFEFSVLQDLFSSAKTVMLQVSPTFDILPVNGLMYPYLLEHPEVCSVLTKFQHDYFSEYFSNAILSLLNSKLYVAIDSSLVLFTHLSLVFVLWFYLKVLFLPFFFNLYIDNNSNDTDHTVSTLVTEAEKEISSIDDLIIIFLVLFFVFGIYFMFYGFTQLSLYFNNYSCVYVIMPFLFFFIYVAPVCLLFDFGIYVFVYLRGSGPTAMLAAELLYDLINLFAYFIRVFIQLSRILLMLIAAGSLQEFIFYFGLDYRLLICNDSFIDTIYNIEFNSKSLTLFFFTKLPLFILYWNYEIFHTYFVVTIQTIAFFAMVFWLFFYLFSFFFSESHENYFRQRRVFYKKLIKSMI